LLQDVGVLGFTRPGGVFVMPTREP